jgi:cytochrome c-type biogenesis protein CcmF
VLAIEGVDSRPFALAMFALGAFVLVVVAQELVRGAAARRGMTGEAAPLALVGVVRRNRRRYGGYTVHAGVALLLIGVAASSSFQHSRQVTLVPGQSAVVDGYKIRYVRPTLGATSQKLSFGAVLAVSRGGHPVTTLRTTRGFYPSQDPSLGQIGRFFGGEADSNVGLQAGLTRDIWTVINPNLAPLQSYINRGDSVFATALARTLKGGSKMTPTQQQTALSNLWTLRDEAIVEIANRFVTHPWPVTFLFIVDPLVSWIWLGAIVVALGGLLALWPGSVRLRRRRHAEVGLRAPSRRAREPVLEPVASVATRVDRG